MTSFKNTDVREKFGTYPPAIKNRLMFIRQLIFEVASELGDDDDVEETLKWGEPSYRTKNGSTLRIDWKASSPEQYRIYFHCSTQLINTFKELYRDKFAFDGNRAIVFTENDDIPESELKQCISMSLSYHRIKHLPLLGA